ncbi:glycoside hydrolase family 6 protein [Actinoplanes oblitus]|uniref:Glucanase n=1 Tax=Actinoplanes oblitus TaxID=3040509 RepID=A0ABY8W9D8_9ACTN|nr:glycoside hydrolase family 6 protein [Actinoplanes oblitus]WIM92999.1 glycoside hydrolase family 6 protein [Actinoplanes oblitus]
MPIKTDTVGVFRSSDRNAYLRTSLGPGNADVQPFPVGASGDVPVVGDWDGDGVDSLGFFRPSDRTFHLRNTLDAGGPSDLAFSVADFAQSGDVPLIGDWDGDGRDGIGAYRPADRTFRLRDALSAGGADVSFGYGTAGDTPIAGDWNGDGRDTVGVFRPSTGAMFLRDSLGSGAADRSFDHVRIDPGDLPIVGDWDGDGTDTTGAYKPSTRTVTVLAGNTATAAVTASYRYGGAGDRPLAGDFTLDTAAPDPARLAKVYGFYADPDAHPDAWLAAHPDDSRAPAIRAAMARRPGAHWFGSWSGDIAEAVDDYVSAAAAVRKVPILVAYDIPGRDCGGASSGGAGSPAAYREWISDFAAGVGDRPAIVVIEPDALAQADAGCMPDPDDLRTRFDLVRYAIEQFGGRAWAYADGGNAHWVPPATMADRLRRAGVAEAHGVAVNVSNFFTTAESTSYAEQVRAGTGKPYLIDTSRNGNGGQPGKWCNPVGAKLGAPSRVDGATGPELTLWVKVPGDSDGADASCGHGSDIPAGTFSPDLATHLINGD